MLLYMLFLSACSSALNLASKITTGTEVTSNQKYPFLVDIEKEFYFADNTSVLDLHCGGVFIPPNSILTAAHCSFSSVSGRETEIISGSELETMVVFGNRLNRTDQSSPGIVKFAVNKIIVHPLYNASRIAYDAAIWKVSLLSGDLSSFTTKIDLDTDISSKSWFGKNATIAGFGALYGEPLLQTRMLTEAQVPIITPSQCQTFYNVNKIDESWICAGNPNPHTDIQAGTCFGDSGGPLFKKTSSNSIILIGIVSNGANIKCGHQPDAFTKVSIIRNWVMQNTAPVLASKLERQTSKASAATNSFMLNLLLALAVSM